MNEKRKPGRPPGTIRGNNVVKTTISLTPEQKQQFLALGGSKWLQRFLSGDEGEVLALPGDLKARRLNRFQGQAE